MTTMIRGMARWLGHRSRECGVHFDRLRQPADVPRVVFSVDGPNDGMASGLRGYVMAEQLRRLGWRATVFPPQLEQCQRARLFRYESPDVVVLQKARHALNSPQLYPGAKVVLDVDDADFLDERLAERYRAVAGNCDAVIAGSRFVADWARSCNSHVSVIWTGKPASPEYQNEPLKPDRPTIIWACSNPHAYPAEAQLVREVMLKVRVPERLTFLMAGVRDDALADAWLSPLRQAGIRCEKMPFCDYPRFVRAVGRAHIGLAPLLPEESPFSAGKSFGKVLAYLDAYVTCVASRCCDHPLFFRHGDNGLLADSLDEWVAAIDWLVADETARRNMSQAAKRDYLQTLTCEAAAAKLDVALRQLLNEPHAVGGKPPQQTCSSIANGQRDGGADVFRTGEL